MDSEENKRYVLREFEAAQAKQAAGIRDAESRLRIRKARIRHFFAAATTGLVFGWIAFIVGKMNQFSGGGHVPIAAACGAGLALVHSIRKERVLRNESAQIRRVTLLVGFQANYNRVASKSLLVFGSIFALICIGVPFAENNYPHAPISRFINQYFLYFLGGGFASLAALVCISLTKLYRVKCPQCGDWLTVRSRRHELENTYSGLCKSCGILWDLDVGNSD